MIATITAGFLREMRLTHATVDIFHKTAVSAIKAITTETMASAETINIATDIPTVSNEVTQQAVEISEMGLDMGLGIIGPINEIRTVSSAPTEHRTGSKGVISNRATAPTTDADLANPPVVQTD